jgi:transposase
MAMTVRRVILGADVSKDWLDINVHGDEGATKIDNTRQAIDALLKDYPNAAIAVEVTNTYHELLVERAMKRGLSVYLISGYQLKYYARSIKQRMRTDPIDAVLLARFLHREIDDLKPYVAKSPAFKQLWQLIKRRALLVQHNDQLRQSMNGVAFLKRSGRSLIRSNQRVIDLIEKRMNTLVKALGWQEEVARVKAMPGVGKLTAVALVFAYRSGDFIHSDPFIAFMGLDVKTKDSGKFKGKRKLTKQGDGEYRRLLHCAAMAAARCNSYFKERYEALQARGLSTTAAYVVIARKLARIAFVLMNKQIDFDNRRLKGA